MVWIITPHSANLEQEKDLFKKSDPYCVITIGSQKKRTKTHDCAGKSPQWKQRFQFIAKQTSMKVQVYDEDIIGHDDFYGQQVVDLKQYQSEPNKGHNIVVEIFDNKKSAGRVLICVQYKKLSK